ncbi:uncharacterized protein LOC133782170 [Humulus lupulus]|uniref:uncharacterized protein LOC133782170 n=1 Tax=Humulus lupulus TaxID=3486 RepID=UPI002B40900F|nr:uncharacterized protein LOC133782170 [Humulus lupulus]
MFSGWCFTTNSAWHKGGRIIVAWNPLRFNVSILSCSNQLIHLSVATVDNKHSFFATFVYGFNDEEGRKSLWKRLQDMARVDPWVVLGDFNDILNRDERIGDRARHSLNNEFINCVSGCQLEDVKYSGNFYTWSNKQQGSDKIYSKIDRVMANQAWMEKFTNAEAIFLNEGIFDHTPAVLTVHSDIPSGKKPFKYFRMWSSHPQHHQEVSRVWHQMVKGTKMYQVVSKLKNLKPIFKELNKRGFSEIHMAYMQAKEKLNDCQNKMHRDPLNVVLQYQELEARKHYAGTLLGTQMDNRHQVKDSIMAHGPVLSIQQADFLSAEFTKEDIKDAMFSIPGIKAPGPDGFCSYFFQDNWDLVGDEISEAILLFLHTGHLLKEINSTVITLIPKCKCPNTVSDYRPISCCNVLYKVATKLICSRLKVILPDLVAQNQGGILQKVGEKDEFLFHDRCRDLKINHLSFADDVLLFCKGDFKSIYLMLQGLKLFSKSSGLNPNIKKTAIYCSGMSEEEIRRVIDVSGFSRSNMPFKYLGIPICAKRISAVECKLLVEKMTARIKSWSARNLSFAGRSTLINSVLLSIHAY